MSLFKLISKQLKNRYNLVKYNEKVNQLVNDAQLKDTVYTERNLNTLTQ